MTLLRLIALLLLPLVSSACVRSPERFAEDALRAVQGEGLQAIAPFLDDSSAGFLKSLPASSLPGLAASSGGQVDCTAVGTQGDETTVLCKTADRSLELGVRSGASGCSINLFSFRSVGWDGDETPPGWSQQ